MKSKEEANLYLDFYEKLLTPKQQQICEFYYREDYSLSEIAELVSITRSAVHDTIKRSSSILEDLEKKLHSVSGFKQRMKYYEKIKELGNEEINQWIDACIKTE